MVARLAKSKSICFLCHSTGVDWLSLSVPASTCVRLTRFVSFHKFRILYEYNEARGKKISHEFLFRYQRELMKRDTKLVWLHASCGIMLMELVILPRKGARFDAFNFTTYTRPQCFYRFTYAYKL